MNTGSESSSGDSHCVVAAAAAAAVAVLLCLPSPQLVGGKIPSQHQAGPPFREQGSLSQCAARPWSRFVCQLPDAQTLLHRIGQPPHWLKALRQLQASREPPDAARPSRAATGRPKCSAPAQASLPLEAAANHSSLAGIVQSAGLDPPAATAATAAESGPAGPVGGEAAATAADADQAASTDDASGISPGVTPPQQQQQHAAHRASR
jgi:hypothetical protein